MSPIDLCQLPKIEGPCKADFIQWYYDRNNNRCLRFRYGGCKGNLNRFNDQSSCESRCLQKAITTVTSPPIVSPVRPSDACLNPLDPGPCLHTVI